MKLSKILLLVTVILILFTKIGFATSELSDTKKYFQKEALLLEEAGILKGDKDGNLQLSKNFKRKDIAIIISRLFNEEDKAKSSNLNLSFKDVSKDDYFYNYVAWAVEKKLLKGINDTEFGTNEDVTLKEIEVILLRTLGYEEEAKSWDLIEPLSQSLGLRDGIDTLSKENPSLTRGELAKIIFNSLFIECKGSTLKLKDILNISI